MNTRDAARMIRAIHHAIEALERDGRGYWHELIDELKESIERKKKNMTKTITLFRCRWFEIKLQRIAKSQSLWHVHPYKGLAILFGSYEEDRLVRGLESTGWKRRWLVNLVGWTAHRVRNGCWSLLFHGPETVQKTASDHARDLKQVAQIEVLENDIDLADHWGDLEGK